MRRFLDLVPMRPVRCPCCRLRIDGKHVWDHRNCAACLAVFKIRLRFLVTTYALAVAISGGLAFAIGNRDVALVSLAGLLLLPTFWAMLAISVRLFPLDIEVVRGGWRPGESDEDRELERSFDRLREIDPILGGPEPEAQAPMLAEPHDGAPGRLPLSAPLDPPISLEGIVIAIAFAALLAWNLYAAFAPHIGTGRTPTESRIPLSPPAR
jgi:hypothetical protein